MPDNTILCLFGKKGSGKSYLAREIIEDWPRVIVLDTMAEYDFPRRAWGFDECCRLLVEIAEEKRYKVSLSGIDAEEGVALLGVLWEFDDTLIVIEEAALYCSPYQMPPEIANLALRGRHRGISQLYTSQRPATIHRSISAQADLVIAFRQHEQRDISYLKSVLGDEAEALRDLPDYHIRAYGNLRKAPLAVLARLQKQPSAKKIG